MKNGSRGFTLIETLVALVVTVSAGLLLANSWSSNYVRVRKTTLHNNVALLLERKAVELQAKYHGKKLDQIKEEEGDFGKEFPEFKWKFATQPFIMPDLTESLGDKKSEMDPTALTVLSKLQEVMGKAILEGKITIMATVYDKIREYTVTLYFVDYESEIAVGM